MSEPRFRLQVRTGPRFPRFPEDDEAFGEALWALVAARLDTGVPRPFAVMTRAEVAHVVDLAPLLAEPRRAHRMVAGLTAVEGVDALAVLGGFFRRKRGGPVDRFALAFIEWPDGRWWLCQQRLDRDGRKVPEFEVEVQRATDGLPRPGGLGGWFSRARFEEIHTSFESTELVN